MARNDFEQCKAEEADRSTAADPYQAFREAERARDVADCRRRLRAGGSGVGFRSDVLREARRLEGIEEDAGERAETPCDLAAGSAEVPNQEVQQ